MVFCRPDADGVWHYYPDRQYPGIVFPGEECPRSAGRLTLGNMVGGFINSIGIAFSDPSLAGETECAG